MRTSCIFAPALSLALSVEARPAHFTKRAGGDIQSSLTLEPSVIATGFANDGQSTPDPGQVASLTSHNNFINFCAGQTITNGKQITTGSCNPAPMGQMPTVDKMTFSKFVFPPNIDESLVGNQTFTIKMKVHNIDPGHFTNAAENYYAAPQRINEDGFIIGHSHFVVQRLQSITQVEPLEPRTFEFFKGVNTISKDAGL